ncbi:hypothetical protein HDU87_003259 [Geranomyces variabilis]|uniref:Uncharacterized protein n=1 Tax=Geranomyces variabilis TaxID=109894 RepID=A0AAD5TK59_9FUNG|nr:hypothetical protein HDU87_003259 [Geranomyces variabilis]
MERPKHALQAADYLARFPGCSNEDFRLYLVDAREKEIAYGGSLPHDIQYAEDLAAARTARLRADIIKAPGSLVDPHQKIVDHLFSEKKRKISHAAHDDGEEDPSIHQNEAKDSRILQNENRAEDSRILQNEAEEIPAPIAPRPGYEEAVQRILKARSSEEAWDPIYWGALDLRYPGESPCADTQRAEHFLPKAIHLQVNQRIHDLLIHAREGISKYARALLDLLEALSRDLGSPKDLGAILVRDGAKEFLLSLKLRIRQKIMVAEEGVADRANGSPKSDEEADLRYGDGASPADRDDKRLRASKGTGKRVDYDYYVGSRELGAGENSGDSPSKDKVNGDLIATIKLAIGQIRKAKKEVFADLPMMDRSKGACDMAAMIAPPFFVVDRHRIRFYVLCEIGSDIFAFRDFGEAVDFGSIDQELMQFSQLSRRFLLFQQLVIHSSAAVDSAKSRVQEDLLSIAGDKEFWGSGGPLPITPIKRDLVRSRTMRRASVPIAGPTPTKKRANAPELRGFPS